MVGFYNAAGPIWWLTATKIRQSNSFFYHVSSAVPLLWLRDIWTLICPSSLNWQRNNSARKGNGFCQFVKRGQMNTNTRNYRTLISMQPSHLSDSAILWNLKHGNRNTWDKGQGEGRSALSFLHFHFKIIINISIKWSSILTFHCNFICPLISLFPTYQQTII